MRRSDFSALPRLRVEIDGEIEEFVDYPAIAKAYAEAVVSKKLIVGKMVVAACQRFLDMLKYAQTGEKGFYYSPLHVIDYCKFVETLSHFESGLWEVNQKNPDGSINSRIILEPWQIWVEAAIQGFRKNVTGARLVRTALELIPRKNAKSLKCCPAVLYDLCCSGSMAPEIPIAAASEKQSDDTIFGDLTKMIANEPDLVEKYKIEVTAKEIRSGSGRVFKLTSQGEKLDGLNPSLAIFEEGHSGAESVFRVVDSAFGSRPGQVLRMITTAGYNPEGPAYELLKQARQVLIGNTEDWTFFAAVYTLDEEDYLEPKTKALLWDKLLSDVALLAKANPMYGISLDTDVLKQEMANRRTVRPDLRGEFVRTRYNIWTSEGKTLISSHAWAACMREDLSIEDFIGNPCWIGVDLAEKRDMCAITLVFHMDDGSAEGVLAVFSKFYLPELSPTALDPDLSDSIQVWKETEYLVLTPGVLADHNMVREEVQLYCDLFDVKMIACDPRQAHNTIKHLWDGQRPVVRYDNNAPNMTAPTDDIIGRVSAQTIWHDGNPVLAWNVQNTYGDRRGNGLVLPRKENDHSKRKIDGFVAMCMANGVRMQPEEAEAGVKQEWASPYARPNAQLIGAD